MVALYVVSVDEAAGKTAICAGLGKSLKDGGRKVGYLKIAGAGKVGTDGDAVFMKQVLGLSEDASSLCLPSGDAGKIKEAYQKASAGKDVLIVEGGLGQSAVDALSRASYEAARAMAARVVVVEAYEEPPCSFTESYRGFGESLLGVILNKVPRSQLPRVLSESARRFGTAVNLLGAMPEDRALLALTVGELAETLQGKILNNAEKSAELVENYMLGAMVVDSGLSYFGRKSRKAVVVRGERPDMQLAALETPTSCLVLSDSDKPPVYNVLEKAANRGIPVIATAHTAADIVTSIEVALSRGRFAGEKKLPRLEALMQQHLNLKAVFQPMG